MKKENINKYKEEDIDHGEEDGNKEEKGKDKEERNMLDKIKSSRRENQKKRERTKL